METGTAFPRGRVVGVVHLASLPGAPASRLPFDGVLDRALKDASAWMDAGADAVLLENHGDAPFPKDRVLPHAAAFLGIAAREARLRLGIPVGVNCLRNDALSSLGAAAAAGAHFIRVNVLAGVVATDQGIVEGCAHDLLRYRSALGSRIQIYADLDVKFGTPLYALPSAIQAPALVRRAGADGIIVTGPCTGAPPAAGVLREVREALGGRAPLFAGSGVDRENAAELAPWCDGVIAGSAAKIDGDPEQPVEPARARALVAALRAAWA